jgi:hypothetical protein
MPQLDSNESDGKGLFIIRNGQKIASYEAGKWVPVASRSRHPYHARRY